MKGRERCEERKNIQGMNGEEEWNEQKKGEKGHSTHYTKQARN